MSQVDPDCHEEAVEGEYEARVQIVQGFDYLRPYPGSALYALFDARGILKAYR